MNCPKCASLRTANTTSCPHCGIVFHKYESYLERKAATAVSRSEKRPEGRRVLAELREYLLTPPATMQSYFAAYMLLWVLFVAWGFSYLLDDLASLGRWSDFLHRVNLTFHEAGHVIFGIFGRFVGSLGGSLGQLLMPVVAGVALLRSRADTFGASICLWWFGQNFLDIAPYIADARAGELMLLGGNTGKTSPYGFHDWEFILGETGLLAYDGVLAVITLNTGRAIMVAALAWGACLLWRAHRSAADPDFFSE